MAGEYLPTEATAAAILTAIAAVCPGESGMSLELIEARYAALPGEIELARTDLAGTNARLERVSAEISELTAKLEAGALDDPGRLAAAYATRRQLMSNGLAEKLADLQHEHHALQSTIYDRRSKAQRAAAAQAKLDYAAACAGLWKLAERVRETAKAAGELINPQNSPHLLGRVVIIGGIPLDVPAER